MVLYMESAVNLRLTLSAILTQTKNRANYRPLPHLWECSQSGGHTLPMAGDWELVLRWTHRSWAGTHGLVLGWYTLQIGHKLIGLHEVVKKRAFTADINGSQWLLGHLRVMQFYFRLLVHWHIWLESWVVFAKQINWDQGKFQNSVCLLLHTSWLSSSSSQLWSDNYFLPFCIHWITTKNSSWLCIKHERQLPVLAFLRIFSCLLRIFISYFAPRSRVS